MKYNNMSPSMFICAIMFVSYCVIISCNSSSEDNSQTEDNTKAPNHGEIAFSEESGFDISYANMDLELNLDIFERSNSNDFLKMAMTVETSNLEMGINVIDPITPPDGGIIIDKSYTIGADNSDWGETNRISFYLKYKADGNVSAVEEYISVNGTVTFKYNAGVTEGTFDSILCKVDDLAKIADLGDTDIETKHIVGTFKSDKVSFKCYTLNDSDTDTYFLVDVDNEAPDTESINTHTYLTSLDHPFCKQYL